MKKVAYFASPQRYSLSVKKFMKYVKFALYVGD